jgi:type 1 glutamine amidotransferase
MQRSTANVTWRILAISLVVALSSGCGGTSAATGAAGNGGNAGGGGGNSGSSGGPGSGAAGTGAAGTSSPNGASGSAGGAPGSTGAAGTGGATASTAGAPGSPDAGPSSSDAAAGGTSDAGAAGAMGSNKVLIYGVTTGFRHDSITAAATAITKAATAAGLTTELVGCTDATNKADPTKFTAAALAQYGAVILLANSGEPFGYPATTEIQNLVDYVQHGGALIGIKDADHCYDGQFNGHPASGPYVNLIGNDFVGHPGGVAPATCTKTGASPAVTQLPATFDTTDEIYAMSMFRMDNQTVLTCVSSGDGTHTMRPVSYMREEGAGRYFYTALGHNDVSWTAPMDAKAPTTRLVEDHVVPALLWAMRR